MATNLSISDSPHYADGAGKIFQRVKREYKRKPGKLKQITDRLAGPINVQTPSGIFLGQAQTYKFKRKPILRVVEKIARGLYHVHTKQFLKTTSPPVVRFVTAKDMLDGTGKAGHGIFMGIHLAQFQHDWNPIFDYRGYVDPAGAGSLWWLRFYQAHIGFVLYEFNPKLRDKPLSR